jgi:hypothetical protein
MYVLREKGTHLLHARARSEGSISRLFSTFYDVLISFNIFRVIDGFHAALVTRVGVGASNSGLAARGIVEDCLPRFALGTGYDKVPLEGFKVF